MRHLAFGLAVIATAVIATPAQSAVVISLFTEGTGVRMNVTGQINLTGLGTGLNSTRTGRADIRGDDPYITIGATANLRSYSTTTTGPGTIGTGTNAINTGTYSGDVFEFLFNPTAGTSRIAFNSAYQSNQRLTGTALFANRTIATLGLTTGDYVFTLTNNETVTFAIGRDAVAPVLPTDPAPGAVPEPATWAMLIGGFGLVGGAMRCRRRDVTFA